MRHNNERFDPAKGGTKGRSSRVGDDNLSLEGVEELYQLAQSLFNATRTASEQASSGDFTHLLELANERERVLQLIVKSREKIGPPVRAGKLHKEINAQVVTLLEAIQKENNSILLELQKRKHAALDKIVEIENRRRVFSYNH